MSLQAMLRFWSRYWSSFSSVVATRSLNRRRLFCAKCIHRRNILESRGVTRSVGTESMHYTLAKG